MSETANKQEIHIGDVWQFAKCGNCRAWLQLKPQVGAPIGGPKIGDCYGGPPTPVLAPTPDKNLGINMIYPRLANENLACAMLRIDLTKLPPSISFEGGKFYLTR